MNWFENISITLAYNPWIFFLGVIILFSYTIFIYRITLPKISKIAKTLLVFVRSLILFLILLLLFDPILKISTPIKVEPNNLIFIDNSKSINEFTPIEEKREIIGLVNRLNSELDGNKQFFTFGSDLSEIIVERFDSINYNSNSTNFATIVDQIKKTENPSSVVIISDGIINDGTNPKYEIEKLNVPIYTIGVGDTSLFSDLSVDQIRSNEIVYSNRETEIEVLLKHDKLENKPAKINLFIDDKYSQSKDVRLSSSGINRINFPIKISEQGTHKISIRANINGDDNLSNNIKSTLINILETKKKIAIIAGSPSRDLSIIIKSIENNEDYEINKIVELHKNKFNIQDDYDQIIRDSDILFLIGFPNNNSDQKLVNNIRDIVEQSNKPIFISFTESIDYTKLKSLNSILPFTIGSTSNSFSESQVIIASTTNSLLNNKSNDKTEAWKNLPPINLNKSRIVPSASSEVLLVNNLANKFPIIFKDNQSSRKSMIVTASNIWKWKLTNSDKTINLFDEFILNSIKWLAVNADDKAFNVKLNEKNYRLGETVTFTASLYDETFEPINNENIVLDITDGSIKNKLNFTSIGNGLYEAKIDFKDAGIKNYIARIENNTRNLPTISGSLNIDPIELEMVDRKLNSDFLKSISINSGGKYSSLKKTNYLFDELNSNYNNSIYSKITDNELRLSTFELILLIIVLLFSIEWISRKLLRMI